MRYFSVFFLSVAGVVFLAAAVVIQFGLFGVSAFGLEYNATASLFLSVPLLLFCALDFIGAVGVARKKLFGERIAVIAGLLGVVPKSLVFSQSAFLLYATMFISDFFVGVPIGDKAASVLGIVYVLMFFSIILWLTLVVKVFEAQRSRV